MKSTFCVKEPVNNSVKVLAIRGRAQVPRSAEDAPSTNFKASDKKKTGCDKNFETEPLAKSSRNAASVMRV